MDVSFDMRSSPGPYTAERERLSRNDWRAHIYDANGHWIETIHMEQDDNHEYYVAHLNEEWEKFKKQLEEDDEDS